jgi:4-amino-4-deoxy-L-arabinose transferase-like glycosyltransferase
VSIYRKLIWIILLAIAVRVAVRGYLGGPDFWENGYTFFFELAKNIAAGNGVSLDGEHQTAFRVPLYPMFLAAVTFGHQAFIPVLVAQSLIGAGTVLCAALIAKELFGNAAAIISAALTAIYPYYVMHDTALQENSLYTFLTALAVLLLLYVRRSGSIFTAAAAGLSLGAAVLTRANLAPFALIAPLWFALAGGSQALPWRGRIRVAIVCASVGMLTVAPWLMRVYQLTGSVTLSTQSGFFLWLGDNPYTFSRYPQESIDHSQAVALAALSAQERGEPEARQHNEALVDEWFRKKALDYMRGDPWETVAGGFRKLAAAFGWLPSLHRSFWPSLAHVLSFGPVMILGLWGCGPTERIGLSTQFFMPSSLPLPRSPPSSSGIPATEPISTFSGSSLPQEFWRNGSQNPDTAGFLSRKPHSPSRVSRDRLDLAIVKLAVIGGNARDGSGKARLVSNGN